MGNEQATPSKLKNDLFFWITIPKIFVLALVFIAGYASNGNHEMSAISVRCMATDCRPEEVAIILKSVFEVSELRSAAIAVLLDANGGKISKDSNRVFIRYLPRNEAVEVCRQANELLWQVENVKREAVWFDFVN